MINRALVIGGGRGVGAALVKELLGRGYEKIYIIDKNEPNLDGLTDCEIQIFQEKTTVILANLINDDYSFLDSITDISTLIITAGFGRISSFSQLQEREIVNQVKVNELAVMRIIRHYYDKIASDQDFFCGIMVSIAGHVASPLFSVYSATKSAVARLIESINAELTMEGYKNRIMDVSPGSLKGTGFNGRPDDLKMLGEFPVQFVNRMLDRCKLYIPDYEEVYRDVIERYQSNPEEFAMSSYEYKMKSGRQSSSPQCQVGYLSGTFDLFHLGHLNLLKRAKQYCDYLVVGVHFSGAWKGKETYIPFEERVEILKSIRYVDKVIQSYPEDCDAWESIRYNYLFVGSDYEGTERFKRYEEYFKDKDVQIVYFPYTKGTSSTQLREALSRR